MSGHFQQSIPEGQWPSGAKTAVLDRVLVCINVIRAQAAISSATNHPSSAETAFGEISWLGRWRSEDRRRDLLEADFLLSVAKMAKLKNRGDPMLTHFPKAVPEIPVSNVEKAVEY